MKLGRSRGAGRRGRLAACAFVAACNGRKPAEVNPIEPNDQGQPNARAPGQRASRSPTPGCSIPRRARSCRRTTGPSCISSTPTR